MFLRPYLREWRRNGPGALFIQLRLVIYNFIPRISVLPFPLPLQGKGRRETLGTRLSNLMVIYWTLGLLYILGGTHAMNFEKICIASHLPFPAKVSFVPVQLHLGRILVCIRELEEQQRHDSENFT